jgi:hypothetical protein
MRTTLDIDDDVLLAVKEIARVRGQSAGRALSDLARSALDAPKPAYKVRNGVPIISRRPGEPLLTMEMVNRLRDEE